MIIVLKSQTPENQVNSLIQEIEEKGLKPVPLIGTERTVIAIIGDERVLDENHISSLPFVTKVMPVLAPYKLASREANTPDTIVDLGDGVTIGGKKLAIMAGPCSVESEEQMMEIAEKVQASGAQILRGGAYKPRTSPYSYEGMGEEGLKILRRAADKFGLKVVTEVLDVRQVDLVANYSDILQIGARNMQNYPLLREVGKSQRAVFLKRGMSATIQEFLLAAEYILSGGNPNVILCERGIRTFETDTRFTLPLATVPLCKELSHLPIIVDPSHGTGKAKFVRSMARAAIAAGADGLMLEVHPDPAKAMSDADQTISPEELNIIMKEITQIAPILDREI
jgi:3-deoxy-7-phosphoheptulonate synthase